MPGITEGLEGQNVIQHFSGQGASQEENYSLWLQSPVWSVMSLSLWFKVAFVLDADVYVTFNVLQQKLKSFQTKGKLKVYKKC